MEFSFVNVTVALSHAMAHGRRGGALPYAAALLSEIYLTMVANSRPSISHSELSAPCLQALKSYLATSSSHFI